MNATINKVNLVLFTLVFSLASSFTLSAQTFNNSLFNIQHPYFDLDYASFKSQQKDKTNLELYLQVTNQELQFVVENGQFRSDLEVSIYIFDDKNNFLDQKFFKKKIIVDDYDLTVSNTDANLFQFDFDLDQNDYELMIELNDLNSNQSSSKRIKTGLAIFPNSSLGLSSIEVSGEILPADDQVDQESGFFKNDRWVLPKPNHEFTVNEQVLGLYFEIYNLKSDAGNQFNSLITRYQIKDLQNRIVLEKSYRLTKPNSNTAAISLNCPLNELSSGKYNLVVTVLDQDNGQSTENQTHFYRWSSAAKRQLGDFGTNIDVLKYIATPREIELLKSADNETLAERITEFWKAKDPTPATPENEVMIEFYSRVMIANRFYSFNKVPGWRTDQGKTFILLGRPSLIYKENYTDRLSKFEVWEYQNSNSRVVFIDKHGFGEFRFWRPTQADMLFGLNNRD